MNQGELVRHDGSVSLAAVGEDVDAASRAGEHHAAITSPGFDQHRGAAGAP